MCGRFVILILLVTTSRIASQPEPSTSRPGMEESYPCFCFAAQETRFAAENLGCWTAAIFPFLCIGTVLNHGSERDNKLYIERSKSFILCPVPVQIKIMMKDQEMSLDHVAIGVIRGLNVKEITLRRATLCNSQMQIADVLQMNTVAWKVSHADISDIGHAFNLVDSISIRNVGYFFKLWKFLPPIWNFWISPTHNINFLTCTVWSHFSSSSQYRSSR